MSKCFRDGLPGLLWDGVGVATAGGPFWLRNLLKVPGTGARLVMVVAGTARPMQTYTEACRPEQFCTCGGPRVC